MAIVKNIKYFQDKHYNKLLIDYNKDKQVTYIIYSLQKCDTFPRLFRVLNEKFEVMIYDTEYESYCIEDIEGSNYLNYIKLIMRVTRL